MDFFFIYGLKLSLSAETDYPSIQLLKFYKNDTYQICQLFNLDSKYTLLFNFNLATFLLTKTPSEFLELCFQRCDIEKYDVRDQKMLLCLVIPQTRQIYTRHVNRR